MAAYGIAMSQARSVYNAAREDQPSSVKQRDYIRKLCTERVNGDKVMNIIVERWGALDMIPKRKASECIDHLMTLPRAKTATRTIAIRPAVDAGFYLHNGNIIKVQQAVHGSGNLYAKKLIIDGDSGSFEYTPGLIRNISFNEKLTLEQAKEFGQLYGMCCRCGATLTDETSIANGIGPVCGGKF